MTFGAGILGGLAGKGLLGALKGKTAEYAQVSSATDGEDFGDQVNRGMVGGGIGRARGDYYRYVGSAEATKAAETGQIPNVNAQGDPKSVFLTTDKFSSGSAAQGSLSMENIPTHRITVDPGQLRLNYGGNVAPAYGFPGGGTEMITRQPIPIDPTKIELIGR